MENVFRDALRAEEEKNAELRDAHSATAQALKEAVAEAVEAVETKEHEIRELLKERESLSAEMDVAREKARVSANRLAAAEEGENELEQRLNDAADQVTFFLSIFLSVFLPFLPFFIFTFFYVLPIFVLCCIFVKSCIFRGAFELQGQ